MGDRKGVVEGMRAPDPARRVARRVFSCGACDPRGQRRRYRLDLGADGWGIERGVADDPCAAMGVSVSVRRTSDAVVGRSRDPTASTSGAGLDAARPICAVAVRKGFVVGVGVAALVGKHANAAV